MSIPSNTEQKIFELTKNNKGLKKLYEELSNRYRSNQKNKSVSCKDQAIAYAMGRMPATYSVCEKIFEELNGFNFETAVANSCGRDVAGVLISS